MEGKNNSKKKAVIIVLIAMIIALLGILGGVLWKLSGNGSNGGTALPENVSAGDVVDVSGIDSSGTPTLTLYVDGSSVNVGEQATVGFRVVAEDRSCESVTVVKSEDNTVLAVLTNSYLNEDNEKEFEGTYTFNPQEADFIEVRAYAGEAFSDEGYISVNDPATDEDYEELYEIMSNLSEYLDDIDVSGISSEKELDLVEEWLKNNSNVAEVFREEDRVVYITKDGLTSFHRIKSTNRFVMSNSSTSTYNSGTTAVQYYETRKKGENLKNDGKISYLPSDITITNKNTLILRPTYNANDGFNAQWISNIKNVVRDSKKLSGGKCDELNTALDVMNKIRYGGLVDYGSVYLCAHGGMSNDYFFDLMDTTNEDELKTFLKNHKDVVAKELNFKGYYNGTWKLRYGTMEEDGVTHYIVEFSSRYIQEVYQDHTFDNTIFFMFSCHGTEDDDFVQFLLNHGAQIVVGSDESVYFDVWHELFDVSITTMYNSTDNNAGKLSQVWLEDGDYLAEGKIRDHISVNEYWEEFRKQDDFDVSILSDIVNGSVNGNIVDEEQIMQYLNWIGLIGKYTSVEIEHIYMEDTETENGEIISAGTIDFRTERQNNLYYYPSDSDFTFGGKGKLSGTVYEGRRIKQIFADGTVNETADEDEPLDDAEITAYRFLAQNFENKYDREYTDETVSDSNGRFVLNGDGGLDWGHYVLEAECEDSSEKVSIIFTANNTDGGEIVVPMGDAEISGYVQGKKSHTDKTVIILDGAKVSLTDAYGDVVKSATVGADGKFEFKKIEPGEYTLNMSCDEYEDYTYRVKLEAGYTYNYEKNNFILEPINSDKDVVLVLDVSGSMSGDPLSSTKTAAKRFAQTVFGSESGYRVSLVTYSSGSTVECGFTKYESTINNAVSGLGTSGDTNIGAGLAQAETLLDNSDAKYKIIVLMSDGMPNNGKTGSELINYASNLKNKGITIYTLGFFSAVDSSQRGSCRSLMASLASHGYHYEVDSTASLSACFNDMADQVNGTKFYVAQFACPVDVAVTYNGETLSSAEDSLCTRTSFGSLMFDGDDEDPTKVFRLREGVNYDITITGTGEGTMDYTLSFADDEGNYSDVRTFENVEVNDKMLAYTNVGRGSQTKLDIDENGDGSTDLTYIAKSNSKATIFNLGEVITAWVLSILGVIALIAIIIVLRRKWKAANRKLAERSGMITPITKRAFCTNCGAKIEEGNTFCTKCGTKKE